jgi:hypothetical protein
MRSKCNGGAGEAKPSRSSKPTGGEDGRMRPAQGEAAKGASNHRSKNSNPGPNEVGLACAADTDGRDNPLLRDASWPGGGAVHSTRPFSERRGRSSHVIGGDLVHGACWLRCAARPSAPSVYDGRELGGVEGDELKW